MILLTIGTQLPFDRLVAAVDALAADLDEPVVAQIGPAGAIPRNLEWHRYFAPAEYDRRLSAARLIVSHAGTGSILAAQRHQKPIILFPRRASLGEHRNDHQVATCAQLRHKAGVYVADGVEQLAGLLSRKDLAPASSTHEQEGRLALIANLREQLSRL